MILEQKQTTKNNNQEHSEMDANHMLYGINNVGTLYSLTMDIFEICKLQESQEKKTWTDYIAKNPDGLTEETLCGMMQQYIEKRILGTSRYNDEMKRKVAEAIKAAVKSEKDNSQSSGR